MNTANPQSTPVMSPQTSDGLPPNTLIDNYRVEKTTASDGISLTYDAVDQRNGESVCLREFFPRRIASRDTNGLDVVAKSPNDSQTFARVLLRATDASRTLAEISDRGIVPLGPGIDENSTRYQVTRPAGLTTLRASLTRRHQPITSTQLNTLMQRLLKTVRTLHDAGLVHGAISPDTVLVNQDLEPFLHISLFDREGNQVKADAATAPYLYDSTPSVELDLYALGASFYHCVAGVGPVALGVRRHELADGEDDPMMSALELGDGSYSKTSLRCIDWLLSAAEGERPTSADEVLQVVSGFAKIGKRGRPRRGNNTSGDPRLDQGGSSWRWLIPVTSFAALAGATWLGFVAVQPWVKERFSTNAAPARLVADADQRDVTPSVVSDAEAPAPAPRPTRPQPLRAAPAESVIQPPPEIAQADTDDEAQAVQLTLNSDSERRDQYQEQLQKEQLEQQIQSRISAAVEAKVSELDALRTEQVQKRKDKAKAYVETADIALGKGEMLQSESGALALYRRALSEDPDNVEAFGGIVAVAASLTERARSALEDGDTVQAEKWAAVSTAVFADQSSMPALLEAIEARKRQDEAEADQAQIAQNEAFNQKLQAFEKETQENAARQEQVDKLLALASDAFTRGDILEPADSGAVALYNRILQIDNKSIEARRGLDRCIGWYADKALDAAVDNDIDKAQRFISRAAQVDADHAIVRIVNKQISQRRNLISQFSERETLLQSEADAARIQLEETREELNASRKAEEAARKEATAATNAVNAARSAQAASVASAQVIPKPTSTARTTNQNPQPSQPPIPDPDAIAVGEAISSYYSADYNRAFTLLQPLAEKGAPRAQFRLAVMYFLGRGAPRDPVTAGAWLNRSSSLVREAATAGTAWAESDLGQMYEEGWSVPQSYETAARWYRRAATKGYAGAQNNLGVLYEQGLGVPRDRDQAVAWLRRAASQGDSVARENLATLGVTP